jgi:DNA-binding CsgD family transcriptional regulator
MSAGHRAFSSSSHFLFIGMTLFMTWINVADVAPDFSKNIDSLSVQPAHTFTLFVTLLFIILLRHRFNKIALKPLFIYFVTALAVVGSVVVRAGYFLTELAYVTTLIGTVLCAFANACCLALWGECYALVDGETDQAKATFAAIPGSFVGIILISVTPPILSFLLVAVLPLVFMACIRQIIKPISSKASGTAPAALRLMTFKHPDNRSLRRLLIFIVAFSLPLNYLNTFLGERTGSISQADWSTNLAVALLFFAAIIAAEYLLRKRNLTILPVVIGLLMTVGVVLYFVFGSATLAITVLTTSGYSLFVAFFYCLLGFSALRSRGAPFLMFALGNIANILGLILGWLLGRMADMVLFPVASYVAIGIVYGVMLVGFYLQPLKSNMFSAQKSLNEGGEQRLSALIEGTLRMSTITSKRFSLSQREHEILSYLMRGRRLDTIADEIGLSKNTVKTHVEHIYRKLDVHSHEELIIRVEQTVSNNDA